MFVCRSTRSSLTRVQASRIRAAGGGGGRIVELAGAADSAGRMWMLRNWMVGVALGLALGLGAADAQDVEQLPGATHVVRPPEVPVPGLAYRDADTVALTLSRKAGAAGPAELLVHEFDFNGEPVQTDKIHLRQVAPGVVEITSVAWEVGYWRFRVRDAASYYGLGERFDALDHAHSVVKNLSVDNEGVKGASSYKPIPFFLSTTLKWQLIYQTARPQMALPTPENLSQTCQNHGHLHLLFLQ